MKKTPVNVLNFDDYADAAAMITRVLSERALVEEQNSPYVYNIRDASSLALAFKLVASVDVAIVDWFITNSAEVKNSLTLVMECARNKIPVFISTSREDVKDEIRQQVAEALGHSLSAEDRIEIYETDREQGIKFGVDGFRPIFDSFVTKNSDVWSNKERDWVRKMTA